MGKTDTFRFPSCDGAHQIFTRVWHPEGQPRGIVQLVHGISEHIDRYAPHARELTEHGFLVVGSDHLGHGRTPNSADEYGFFCDKDGWHTVAGDVRRLRVLMGERYPDLPYFMLGHSMGSFLTRTYLIDWPGTLTGAILSGTGQEPEAMVAAGHALASAICRLSGPRAHSPLIEKLSFGAYNSQFKPARTRSDWISRDEAVVDAYLADPMCNYPRSVGLFRDMLGGLQYIAKASNLGKMDPSTPIYFFSGDKDPVGGNGKGVEKVAGFFGNCRDVTVRLYPDGRHEMMNEINRAEVFADLIAWLDAHMP